MRYKALIDLFFNHSSLVHVTPQHHWLHPTTGYEPLMHDLAVANRINDRFNGICFEDNKGNHVIARPTPYGNVVLVVNEHASPAILIPPQLYDGVVDIFLMDNYPVHALKYWFYCNKDPHHVPGYLRLLEHWKVVDKAADSKIRNRASFAESLTNVKHEKL